MRLYFAAMDPKGPKNERKIPAEKILLSYYDIHLRRPRPLISYSIQKRNVEDGSRREEEE